MASIVIGMSLAVAIPLIRLRRPTTPPEKQSKLEFSPPGVGKLISAVSKANFTSSLIVFKAIGIAPCCHEPSRDLFP
ncbi:hypothetical protein K443DRAFT_14322 [Laccaria amethystina LaAM-08-1]|uniref:Uncharacterized protein n=1 Tax=Laccaria amethystina LaAM-08-1 TaxID=1095629 RepID=A0A0C9WHN7_9AGAR|nr:hypothetical protein K443DRAFT_14322 [Laccaria amethystina LaAM-08-1]